MNKGLYLIAGVLMLWFGFVETGRSVENAHAVAPSFTLKSGTYVGEIQGVISHSCFEKVKHTLESIEGISYVSVDPRQSTVQFTVKNDATLRLPEVQWALRAAGMRTGHGAFYRHNNIVKVSKD